MGGYGSGRPGNRPIAEESLALPLDRHFLASIARLQRAGIGHAGHVLTWYRGDHKIAACGVAFYLPPDGHIGMVLSYSLNGDPRRQAITIDWTATPFGRRPWWQCPLCRRRCARLYNPQGHSWYCRRCWNVTYTSSNESDKRLAYGRCWDVLDQDVLGRAASTGALIMALRAHRRIEEKITRDRRRAGHGKPGRPRKTTAKGR
jgi:hypothetical protein